MDMLDIYRLATERLEPALNLLLKRRLKNGKEVADRVDEKRGITGRPRPAGALVLLHAASVGEAQSALILVDRLIQAYPRLNVLVTTGTVTSARMMEKKLPGGAFHQFAPMDHPAWAARFLDHWQPDLVLWMESELWPNTLRLIRDRDIPAVLVNARLSDKSFRAWKFFGKAAREIVSVFRLILAQTEKDTARFETLGARAIITTGNLKFSAKPLTSNDSDLKDLHMRIGNRPVWLFASTHKGEEALACRVHEQLKAGVEELLTIIVPRHPARRMEIRTAIGKTPLHAVFRGETRQMPMPDTDVYVADTMGELGLFYRAAPVACIGRSFSDDGGGGHNPIEAAQLHCAVLFGPRVQYQQEIYDTMEEAKAAVKVSTEAQLVQKLHELLTNPSALESLRQTALSFLQQKEQVIETVMAQIGPLVADAVDKADRKAGRA